MPDIVTLRMIWWVLMGVVIIGFAITDGFDLGAAILMPFIARTEAEKRVLLNTILPYWEGNQVWIILGAGAIFAAWPYVYAAAFSGFYILILLLLLTLGISRPVSFKYRSKIPNQTWLSVWDGITFIGGFVPACLFGLLVGNVLLGIPFYYDENLRYFFTGSLTDFFNPFAFLCLLVSLAMIMMHGSFYLAVKTYDPIKHRAQTWGRYTALITLVGFAIGGFYLAHLPQYQVLGDINISGPSNPTVKQVIVQTGAWFNNYKLYPYTMIAPTVAFLGLIIAAIASNSLNGKLSFIASGLAITGIIATVGTSMFPFILPSATKPSHSLLVWDASSSQLTLLVMLFAAIIFLPLILMYTSWVYYALRGPEKYKALDDNKVNNQMLGH